MLKAQWMYTFYYLSSLRKDLTWSCNNRQVFERIVQIVKVEGRGLEGMQ